MNLLTAFRIILDALKAARLRKRYKNILIKMYIKNYFPDLFERFEIPFGNIVYVGNGCYIPLDFNPNEAFKLTEKAIQETDFSKN